MRQYFTPICYICFWGVLVVFAFSPQTLKAEDYTRQLTTFAVAKLERNVLQIFLQIKIKKGWHIYSAKKKPFSISTKVELLGEDWKLQEIVESPPVKIYDEVYQDFLFVHQAIAEFKLKALKKGNQVSPKTVAGNLIFSICNQKSCSLPQKIFFKTTIS